LGCKRTTKAVEFLAVTTLRARMPIKGDNVLENADYVVTTPNVAMLVRDL